MKEQTLGAVLRALRYYAQQGNSSPTIGQLAAAARVSERSVKSALGELKATGKIEIMGGNGRRNEYDLDPGKTGAKTGAKAGQICKEKNERVSPPVPLFLKQEKKITPASSSRERYNGIDPELAKLAEHVKNARTISEEEAVEQERRNQEQVVKWEQRRPKRYFTPGPRRLRL
jgi:hypothetical protein